MQPSQRRGLSILLGIPILKIQVIIFRMKFAVLSLATDALSEMRELTFANKRAYCEKHGYQWIGANKAMDSSRPPAWSKIRMLQEACIHLPGWWAFWTDADSLIVRPDWKIESIADDNADLIISQERGRAVARCLGAHPALILRNHGIVAAGASIEETVWTAIKLEKACQLQLLAEAAGGPKLLAEGADLDKKRSRADRPDLHANTFGYLVRKWRCQCCGEIVPAPHVTTFENRDQR